MDRLFGFLFGTVVAGSSVYSYLVSEYKVSNDLLTEDIYVRYSRYACSALLSYEP